MADEEGGDSKSKEYQLKGEHSYKIVTSHMQESYEKAAIDISIVAVDKFKHLKDIAFYIKQSYDKKYPGSGKATEGVYHCAVGKSFASSVSHETRHFIHLKVDTYHIVLWKSKDTPFNVAD
ncbi:hypothetical protein FOA52_011621 [Chlamydomonas sp. UWO 241]|nr:hypothetical protein FOA52_011621 [Chlamydomonas sp. UWO 241]